MATLHHGMGGHRISVLDFVRGFSLLGILVVNLPGLSGEPRGALQNLDSASAAAWVLQQVVLGQRLYPLFAMLFGASFLLQWERSQDPRHFAAYYRRRMALLLLFGVAHAYLLWPGDVLITYSLCGLLLLSLRSLSAPRLFLIGVLCKIVELLFLAFPDGYFGFLRMLRQWGLPMPGPAPSSLAEAYQGTYAGLLNYYLWKNTYYQWLALPSFRFWGALAFMLLGMALFKWGILQGERSRQFYLRMLGGTLAMGAPLVVFGSWGYAFHEPIIRNYLKICMPPVASKAGISLLYGAGCAITSFSLLAGLHLWFRAGVPSWWRQALQSCGRMALSNYLLQSLAAMALFQWLRLLPWNGLRLDQQWLLAASIGAGQLLLSVWWLRRFSYGPVEWIWRRATRLLLPKDSGQLLRS